MEKILTIFLFLFTLNATYSVDVSDFERVNCSDLLKASNRGYSIREPLVFHGVDGTSTLQKVTREGETFYQYRDILGTFLLRKNLKNVRDFVVVEDKLWVAADLGLYEFNDKGRMLNYYEHPSTTDIKTAPWGMDLKEDKLLMAYGSLGLVEFDLASRSFTVISELNSYQDNGERSMASAVLWQGDRAFVVMTGRTQYAFHGFAIYNLKSQSIENLAEYNRSRYGVIDRSVKIYAHEGRIVLNNGGWIHHFSSDELIQKSKPKVAWLPIPWVQDNRRSFLQIRGDIYFDGAEMKGCAIYDRQATMARISF